MKTLKKVLVLCLLVVFSLTLLTACGGDETGDIDFTVTYNLNCDDASFAAPLEIKYHNSQRVIEPRVTPVRPGYKFVCWSDKEDASTRYEGFGTYISESITLYAKWVPKTKYVANFYCSRANTKDEPKLMFSFGGDNDKLYADSKLDKDVVNQKLDDYRLANPTDFLNYSYNSSLFCGNDTSKKIVNSNLDINIADYVEFANENNEIVFYISLVEKSKSISFTVRTETLLTAKVNYEFVGKPEDNIVKGVIDLNKVTSKFNNNDYFVLYNGKRVMPKEEKFIATGYNFKYWEVNFNDKGQTVAKYDKDGNLINSVNNGNSEFTPTDKFIDLDAQKITKVSMIDELIKSEIKFKYREAKGGADNSYSDPVEIASASIFQDFGTKIRASEFPKIEDFYDKATVKDKVILSWVDEKGVEVDGTLMPARDITVYALIVDKKKEAKFVTDSDIIAGTEQFFKGSQERNDTDGIKTVQIKNLDAYLRINETGNIEGGFNPNAFNLEIGGMYEIINDLKFEIQTGDTFKRNDFNEKELNKEQATLLGFKYKGTPDSQLVIVVNKEGKLVLADSFKQGGTVNPNGEDFVVFYPVFSHKKDNVVTLSDKAAVQTSSKVGDKVVTTVDYNANLTYKTNWAKTQNTPARNKLDFIEVPTAVGYKFVRWEIVKNQFGDNKTDAEAYNKVEFKEGTPVICDITICPVFEPDKYTIKFVDNNDNLRGEFEVNFFKSQLTKEQIAQIKDIGKVGPNGEIDEKNPPLKDADTEKVFVDWIITINGEEKLFSDIQDMEFKNDYTFRPKFKYISYGVDYRLIDYNESVKQYKAVEGTQQYVPDIFNCKGLIEGKTINEYTDEKLKYTNAKGNVVSYVTGWFYWDKDGNKVELTEKTVVNQQLINENNTIEKKKNPLVNVYTNAIVVHPILTEFDVTIDANNGEFTVKQEEQDESGDSIEKNATTFGPIKAGAFGINPKEFDKITALRRLGYTRIGMFIEKEVLVDNVINKEEKPIDKIPSSFTENTLIKIDWEVDNYDVQVYFVAEDEIANLIKKGTNINQYINDNAGKQIFTSIFNGKFNEKFVANIEGVMSNKNIGKYINIIDYINIITKEGSNEVGNEIEPILEQLAKAQFKPLPSFSFKIYEVNNDNNMVMLNKLKSVQEDHNIFVEIVYNEPALKLDAGLEGAYTQDELRGYHILETHIMNSAPRTQKVNGKSTVYLSKTQDGNSYYVDQCPPVRNGYIFAGFSIYQEKEKTLKERLAGTIYYGYSDGSDIESQIFNTITNKIWLGKELEATNPTDSFMHYALTDKLITMYDVNGQPIAYTGYDSVKDTLISRVEIKGLYAVWVPVNVKVNYYKTYQENGLDVPSTDVTSNSDYIGPNDKINNNSKHSDLIRWTLTSGTRTVEEGAEKKLSMTFVDGNYISKYYSVNDYANLVQNGNLKLNTTGDYYYYSESDNFALKLYEILNVNTEIKVKVTGLTADPQIYLYDSTFSGNNEYEDGFKPVYKPDFTLEFETIDGKKTGFVIRNTFQIKDEKGNLVNNGEVIDSIVNKRVNFVKIFAQNVNGAIDNSGNYYEVNLTAVPVVEKIPVVVSVDYMTTSISKTIKHNFNDKLVNPYADKFESSVKVKADVAVNPTKTEYSYTVKRFAWYNKLSGGTLMDPVFNDATQNLVVGEQLDEQITANFDNNRPMFVTDFDTREVSLIIKAKVFGAWKDFEEISVGGKTYSFGNLTLSVKYEAAPEQPNVATTPAKLLIPNPTNINVNQKFAAEQFIANPTASTISTDGKMRRTWTINGVVMDNDPKQDGKLVNSITIDKAILNQNTSQLKLNEAQSSYDVVVEVKAVETWVPNYSTTV